LMLDANYLYLLHATKVRMKELRIVIELSNER